MRGVATGGDGNHSGSLPSVGTYLDEQPVTTIGGTLDVHIYDIARIESLAGPQGTLYGASSEAGTIRIITNKPELGVTTGRVDGEVNSVDHGGMGGKLEGMINLPIGDRTSHSAASPSTSAMPATSTTSMATRDYCGDAILDRDSGDPSAASTTAFHVDNAAFVKKNFNTNDDLRRARGAEDRPQRQLDGHADHHASEFEDARASSLRTRRSATLKPSGSGKSPASTSSRNMR